MSLWYSFRNRTKFRTWLTLCIQFNKIKFQPATTRNVFRFYALRQPTRHGHFSIAIFKVNIVQSQYVEPNREKSTLIGWKVLHFRVGWLRLVSHFHFIRLNHSTLQMQVNGSNKRRVSSAPLTMQTKKFNFIEINLSAYTVRPKFKWPWIPDLPSLYIHFANFSRPSFSLRPWPVHLRSVAFVLSQLTSSSSDEIG